MKKLDATENLIDLIKNWNLSKDLSMVHDLVVYSIDPSRFNSDLQNALFSIKQVSKAIKAIEKQIQEGTQSEKQKE